MATATVDMAGEPIRGEYHGGAYIDLSFANYPGSTPFDVINVYDYAKGKSTIPNTSAAVRREMIEWRDSHEGDSLSHDLLNYAESINL
jgi:hypothetical protein